MMDSGTGPREGFFLSLELIVHWFLAVVIYNKLYILSTASRELALYGAAPIRKLVFYYDYMPSFSLDYTTAVAPAATVSVLVVIVMLIIGKFTHCFSYLVLDT